MTRLSDQQKQLLFDYALGLASDREAVQVEKLLAWNQEAIELQRTFQVALAPLDSVELDRCPDELTERLSIRLKAAGRQDPDINRLEELLAAERLRSRTIKIPLWRNWTEVVTAAAAVFLFMSILFPSVGFMRQRYAQTHCGTHLAGVYEGFRNYMSDHDGLVPAVAMTPGSPWWKVGYQGQENYSNTRRPWLLVKNGYVQPNQFLCPGRRELYAVSYDGFKVQNLNDFPSQIYIQYSIHIACPTSIDRDLRQKGVLLADRNPLSEALPSDLSERPNLRLDEGMMTANSRNHRNRGQNALLNDGSVEFIKARHSSVSDDDIYVLQGMSCNTEVSGCELPSCNTDIFLVP
ncbi:MAG: hypothetical protein NTZ17_09650 [Phycisphaerae bacterium]|nr:hypothetical protein [Phycisphaerae bacterium]